MIKIEIELFITKNIYGTGFNLMCKYKYSTYIHIVENIRLIKFLHNNKVAMFSVSEKFSALLPVIPIEINLKKVCLCCGHTYYSTYQFFDVCNIV